MPLNDDAKLKMLSMAAKLGAGDDDLKAMLAAADGEKMITFYEVGGGAVQVKPHRVLSVCDRADGTTVLEFDTANASKRCLHVNQEAHKVERSLIAAGWQPK